MEMDEERDSASKRLMDWSSDGNGSCEHFAVDRQGRSTRRRRKIENSSGSWMPEWFERLYMILLIYTQLVWGVRSLWLIEDGSEGVKEPMLNCAAAELGQDINSSIKRTCGYTEPCANGVPHHDVARVKDGETQHELGNSDTH